MIWRKERERGCEVVIISKTKEIKTENLSQTDQEISPLLAFIMKEGATHRLLRDKIHSLTRDGPYMLQCQPVRLGMPTGTILERLMR